MKRLIALGSAFLLVVGVGGCRSRPEDKTCQDLIKAIEELKDELEAITKKTETEQVDAAKDRSAKLIQAAQKIRELQLKLDSQTAQLLEKEKERLQEKFGEEFSKAYRDLDPEVRKAEPIFRKIIGNNNIADFGEGKSNSIRTEIKKFKEIENDDKKSEEEKSKAKKDRSDRENADNIGKFLYFFETMGSKA